MKLVSVKSSLFHHAFLVGLLVVLGPGMWRECEAAGEPVIDCGTAVAHLEAGWQSEPEQVLVLFRRALERHPDCHVELVAAMLELAEPTGEALFNLLLVARDVLPGQASTITEIALALSPDGSQVIQDVMALDVEEVKSLVAVAVAVAGEAPAPASAGPMVSADPAGDGQPDRKSAVDEPSEATAPEPPVASVDNQAMTVPAGGDGLGNGVLRSPQDGAGAGRMDQVPDASGASGEGGRAPGPVQPPVGGASSSAVASVVAQAPDWVRASTHVDDEVREAMARMNAMLEGKSWEEQAVPDVSLAFRRADRIRVSRGGDDLDEDNMTNSLPYDEFDEEEAAAAVERVIIADASHESLDSDDVLAILRPSIMENHQKEEKAGATTEVPFGYVPHPSTLLAARIYSISPPAGPATPRELSKSVPESRRNVAVIRPRPASASRPY